MSRPRLPLSNLLRLLPLLPAVVLVGCVAPISVQDGKPEVPPTHAVPVATLEALRTPDRRDPMRQVGPTLDALRAATERVGRGDDASIPELNYLTARLVDQLIAAEVRPWMKELRVNSETTEYLVRGHQPEDLDSEGRRFITTDRLRFSGRYAIGDPIQDGVGAPLVAYVPLKEGEHSLTSGKVRFRTITAVVNFEGDTAVVRLEDPLETDEVRIGGRRLPLKADYGSNMAYALSTERIDKLGLARMINPTRYDVTARLQMLQPYDPDRIPVLLIHGLQDTPASYAPMFFELMADPEIRRHYQFWVFSYPSGYPYPIPASKLRQELDRVKAAHPEHKDLVVIGHSMGGLITRLMVTDVGDGIWREYFGTTPADTKVSGRSRELLEEALLFESRTEVDRTIFIAAPHRGSELATNIVGWIGIKLVRFPNTFANVLDTVINTISFDAAGFQLDRFPNSIDTLSPSNSFIKAINTYPIHEELPYHSIMGNRGKPGPREDSSDGVVAYWSSHLDGARSERLVPSGHSAHQNPEGIEEVRRILHLHADLPYEPLEIVPPPEPERKPLRGNPARW